MIKMAWQRADVSNFIDYKASGYRLTTRSNQHGKQFPEFNHRKKLNGHQYIITEGYRNQCSRCEHHKDIVDGGENMCLTQITVLGYLIWRKVIRDTYTVVHRDDGPAMIYFNPDGSIRSFHWVMNGETVNDIVCEWIREMDLPSFDKWTDSHKALFKLRFGGVGYKPQSLAFCGTSTLSR